MGSALQLVSSRVLRSIRVKMLATSLACLISGAGISGQASPSGTFPVQQPGTLESEATFDETPELLETKLAAIDAASVRNDVVALRGYLKDLDAQVQSSAFEALAARNTASAIQDLVQLFNDAHYPGRSQVLQILDESVLVESERMMALLRNATHDPDPIVSDYALQAIANRTGVVQSGGTSPGAADDSPETFESMAARDTPVAIQGLILRIRDKTKLNRLQDLRLLDEAPQVDEATVIDVLREVSHDDNPAIRDFAAEALARRSEPGRQP